MEEPVVVPASTPTTETVKTSASDAAILADDIPGFLDARRHERAGKPLDAVDLQVEKAADGSTRPIDPREAKRAQRAAKQSEINEGARKAAGRIVEDYETKIKERDGEVSSLKARLAQLESAMSGRPVAVSPPVTATQSPALAREAADPEPSPTNLEKYPGGEYDPKYIREAAAWDARQWTRQQQAEARQREVQQQHQASAQTKLKIFSARIEAAKQADATFPALTPAIAALRPTSVLGPDERPTALNALAEEILISPVSPQLVRHFIDHPDDLSRFSAYETPRELLRAFTQLESTCETVTAPAPVVDPPNPITRAPTPPTVLGSNPTTPADPLAAAVKASKGSLSGGVRDYRAARAQERLAAQGKR